MIEQDHRGEKSRTASMLDFKTFKRAAATIAGIELLHRIQKGAVRPWVFGRSGPSRSHYLNGAAAGLKNRSAHRNPLDQAVNLHQSQNSGGSNHSGTPDAKPSALLREMPRHLLQDYRL